MAAAARAEAVRMRARVVAAMGRWGMGLQQRALVVVGRSVIAVTGGPRFARDDRGDRSPYRHEQQQ